MLGGGGPMADAIYLRKSRMDLEAERHGAGDTLLRHKNELMALSQSLGLHITHIYQEVVSGETITARPQMQQLLRDIEAGLYDHVVCMEVERLARGDTLDQGIVSRAFRFSGTKIVTPKKTYDPNSEFDEEYFEFGLFMSRREYKTINRRQQAGRAASVREGKWPGNRTPYGYSREKLTGQKGWILVPNDQAPTVASVYQWYTEGLVLPDGSSQRLGVSRIVRRLNDLGIPAPNGKDWTNPTIVSMLRNEAYAGWVRWGRRKSVKRLEGGELKASRPVSDQGDYLLERGLHTPIVSQETFDKAQVLLSANPSRPGPLQYAAKNPLGGLVKCGLCGRTMVRRPYGDRRSPSLLCPYTSCPNISSDLSLVEDAILLALEQWCEQISLAWGENAQPSQEAAILRAALEDLSRELAGVEQQTERSYDLVEQGVYTAEIFLSRSRELSSRRAELEQRMGTIAGELARYEQSDVLHTGLLPGVQGVVSTYRQTEDAEEQRALLHSILDHVTYLKTERARRDGSGGNMAITIHPRLPHK